MIFRQITHDDLGCASYLIGDEDAGVAAVIDPKLEIDEYLRLARPRFSDGAGRCTRRVTALSTPRSL
jgi:hypothetical protein